MECAKAQEWIYRKIDEELSQAELAELDRHLHRCVPCSREYGILMIPRRVAGATAQISESPFFYSRLRTRIQEEEQYAASWQPILRLARRMVPAMAGLTLALFSVFAYLQSTGTKTEIYNQYGRVFVPQYQAHPILTFEQNDITNATVLNAIAYGESETADVR